MTFDSRGGNTLHEHFVSNLLRMRSEEAHDMDSNGTITLPSGEVAQWHVHQRVMHVCHGHVVKSSELGGFSLYPQALASILLSEIVLDWQEAGHRDDGNARNR